MELRPRTAPVDIGNRVAEPRTRSGGKKVAGARGQESGTRPVLAKIPEKRTREAAVKKVLSPVPETRSQPEPIWSLSLQPPWRHLDVPHQVTCCVRYSDVLLDIEDVDVKANADLNSCSSYAKDIYNYLRDLEASQPVRPKHLDGQKIPGNVRAILIDRIVRAEINLKLQQGTLYMTVAITDRLIQDNAVTKRTLQLVGVAAMFIVSKYEEILSPAVEDFACVTNHSYTKLQICQMEMKILQALGFCLGHPLPPHFLRRASMIAEIPALQYHMSYTERDLLPVMQHIAKNVILVNEGITQHVAIKEKYSTNKNIEISGSEELKSSVTQHLAQPLMQELTPL